MKVSIGPVTAAEFAVIVTLSDQTEPSHFAMQIDGKGGVGFVARIGDGRSRRRRRTAARVMTYSSDVQVGGRIAAVGQRLIESVGTDDDEAGARRAERRAAGARAGRRMKPAPFDYHRPRTPRRGAGAARRARRRRQAARRRPEPDSGDELPAGDAGGARRSQRASPSSRYISERRTAVCASAR